MLSEDQLNAHRLPSREKIREEKKGRDAMQTADSVVISVTNLSKCYHIYDRPQDRLKQSLIPRFQRLFGRSPTQYAREFWALKDVSFVIKKGETVGIIGRNGSGKSTLLQLICGTLNPTSGSIQTNGRVAALLELGSGFNPEFTGRENVYMNAAVLGLSKEEIDGRFDDIAAFADIGEFIEQPIKTYSSGMFVRLAFAIIAHVDADILVIDEALAVGDAFFTQKCMRFMRTFMKTGTVLFVSHDTGAIKNLCQNAIWLEGGEMKLVGPAKAVTEKYLEAFYEEKHGTSTRTRLKKESVNNGTTPKKDARLEFINASSLRKDIELFDFDPAAASFGKGGAEIVRVALRDKHDSPLAWVVGGEEVTLTIAAEVFEELDSPIIGFSFKDRLGQVLFGDNTYRFCADHSLRVDAGHQIEARFKFTMPILPTGDYSICVALANGTQQDHVQHHWIHDALIVKSHSSSVGTGLVGIPMALIEMVVLK